jgi:tRNA dimethylallyltransferase
LGVQVASHFNGEILSADSRQIYRGMDIGTGKDLAEYENNGRSVRYHLIDIANPAEIYSLWNYQRDFYATFEEVRASQKLPVVVGGSGLYIEAVLKNYEIPDVPEDVDLRRSLMDDSKEELLMQLQKLDPSILEKTDVSSKKRIVRSLEVALYAQDHEVRWGIPDPPDLSPLIMAIRLPRPVLYEQIRQRLEDRFNEGMIEEVERLMAGGISRERLKLFGMEYGHIGRYLAGEVSREVMVEELRVAICHFAKRQDTWFRGMERRGLAVHWIDGPGFEEARKVIREHL